MRATSDGRRLVRLERPATRPSAPLSSAGMEELSQEEGRVLGSLIEKALTTPQQYPLSLNALALACNQSSNRDPVVSYEETTVADALDRLKERGLVRFVLPSHGRSVVRYRQVADELLALDQRQLALMAVLLLRGPQTVGELRFRTERMADFENLAEVEHDLRTLSDRIDPLVSRLVRRPGQKEERWRQLLSPESAGRQEPVRQEAPSAAGTGTTRPGAPAGTEGSGPRAPTDGLAELREELTALRRDLDEVRAVVDDLRRSLGG